MYSPFQLATKFLRYYLTASNGKGHGIHSPFIYEFVSRVLNDKRDFYAYVAIEELRQQLLRIHTSIKVDDFGAGSAKKSSIERKISDIARYSAKPPKYGKLLFRIAEHYQCKKIVELGTSLGISTAYLASADQDSHVITLEGSYQIAHLAKNNFQQLKLRNIELQEGNFNDVLGAALKKIVSPDLVFFDGNHRLEPTLNYFHHCLQKSHENSIFVFDDIHWSSEMEQAWKLIKVDDRVTCTIDLFFIGLVFFRESFKQKQHFVIRF